MGLRNFPGIELSDTSIHRIAVEYEIKNTFSSINNFQKCILEGWLFSSDFIDIILINFQGIGTTYEVTDVVAAKT